MIFFLNTNFKLIDIQISNKTNKFNDENYYRLKIIINSTTMKIRICMKYGIIVSSEISIQY